jgi:hypothetical protein
LYAKKPQQFSISLRSLLGFEESTAKWVLELLSNSEFFRKMVSRKTHPKGMVFLMLWKICKNPEKKNLGKSTGLL